MARICISPSQMEFESGCKIYTTAEIVIAEFDDVVYKREFAEESGYEELVVYDL